MRNPNAYYIRLPVSFERKNAGVVRPSPHLPNRFLEMEIRARGVHDLFIKTFKFQVQLYNGERRCIEFEPKATIKV